MASTASATSTAHSSTTLQRVIFPVSSDPDLLTLFADTELWTMRDGCPLRISQNFATDAVLSRSSIRLAAGKHVSFASYFNAFPASYWQRWTVVRQVTLRLRTSGPGTVIVYRSNSYGVQQQVCSHRVQGEAETEVDLPLTSFSDGGWYWFDLIAGSEELVLLEGAWQTTAAPVSEGKLCLGMTTFNKPDYCVRTLSGVAADEELTAELDRIFLVDQGTRKVADEPGFDEVASALGSTLQVINQGNLGGSGGFSRSMAETLRRDDADFLLLIDDDVEFETESALRALKFARFCERPVLVGGHMFDLLDKPVLHAWAEVVRPEPFMWGPSFEEQFRHDFRETNLRQTPWMHARLDADYNGWWMCLIPKQVIAEIGLSLPVFIKWDDAEYGLRAKAAGYRTVSLPGMALWHVSWLDKDDSQDWQAYFHTRNRIIAGLLHSTQPGSGKLLQNSGRQDVKKLLNMQYYATALAVQAMRDVLAGPEHLHSTISTDMPRARELAANYPETRVYRSGEAEQPPAASGGRALPERDRNHLHYPKGLSLGVFTAKLTAQQLRRRVSETDRLTPELEYAKIDAYWWKIPHHTSVVVGSADGSGKMWYHFDRDKFRSLLLEARRLNRELHKNWERLSAEYRAALPQLVSVEEWEKTFAGR